MSLADRARQSEVTDIEFVAIPRENGESKIVTDTCNEIVFEGKILSPAEREAQKYSEMFTALMVATNRAFEEGCMFK